MTLRAQCGAARAGEGLSTTVTVADLLSSCWDAYGEDGAAGYGCRRL